MIWPSAKCDVKTRLATTRTVACTNAHGLKCENGQTRAMILDPDVYGYVSSHPLAPGAGHSVFGRPAPDPCVRTASLGALRIAPNSTWLVRTQSVGAWPAVGPRTTLP